MWNYNMNKIKRSYHYDVILLKLNYSATKNIIMARMQDNWEAYVKMWPASKATLFLSHISPVMP